ncbi:MAG: hypothetical protein FWC55_02665 [Firmicutes bacterium]|nr:hypothetical protein [Bacillota bacterium]
MQRAKRDQIYKAEIFDRYQYYGVRAPGKEPIERFRIDLAGRVDEETLKRAVTLSMKTLPLIGCCYEDRPFRPRWVEKGFTGEDTVRVFETEGDLESEVRKRLFAPIHTSSEPQLKINIVRRGGEDTLCVLMPHMVADGGGFKQYLVLLSRLYTKLKNGETPPEQSFERRDAGPLFAGLKLRERLRLMLSKYVPYGLSDNLAPEARSAGDGGEAESYTDRGILPLESIAALRTLAKANGGTVNDGLMALVARAYGRNCGAKTMLLASLVDLRRYIPKGMKYGITNYTGGCVCSVSIGPDDSPADTVRQISGQMAAFKSGNDLLKSALEWDFAVRFVPNFLLKRIQRKITKPPFLSVSNHGVIETGSINFGDLPVKDLYFTTMISKLPYFVFIITTYGDRCTVTCNMYGSKADRELVLRMLEDMREEAAEIA